MNKFSESDLHSNNSVVVVSDEADRIVYRQRLPNELSAILQGLEPHRSELVGVVVESTYYARFRFTRGRQMIRRNSPGFWPPRTSQTSHNHKPSRNSSTRPVGWYRWCFIFGVCNALRARSFMAKSASMYICVVAGLSWPNQSAITVKSTPD